MIQSSEDNLAICFQILVLFLEHTPKSSLPVNYRSLVFVCPRILRLREFFLVPFRPLLDRIAHTNSQLARRH